MKIRTGILVDVVNNKIESKEIEYENDEELSKKIKNLLGCDWIDWKFVTFNKIQTYIAFDDMGKMKEEVKAPAVLLVNEKTLNICDFIVGNVWIEKFDGVNDTTSFSNQEIKKILSKCKFKINNEYEVLLSIDNWVNFDERYGALYD